MWQKYLQLRQQYLEQPKIRTEIYQNYVRNMFLYELSALSGNDIRQEVLENIISSDKPQHTPSTRKAYDLWQAWKYTEKSAEQHRPFTIELLRHIAARVMKHSGGETTTTVGRYDSSLGDFRLGEDYTAVYSIADYRKIPVFLDALCQETDIHLKENNITTMLQTAAAYLYKFAHIKPFGGGNIETGLLSVNYKFLYHRYPLLFIFSEDKAAGLDALKSKDMNHIPGEFEEFIVRQQIKFFEQEIE